MKVILLQNVPRIGQKGDIKEVKDGFVRNMLLPKKLAKIATEIEIKKLAEQSQFAASKSEKFQKEILKTFKEISKHKISIEERANEKGHLFAQVNVNKIVEAVKNQLKIDINPEYLKLKENIKEVGEHEVTCCYEDQTQNFIVEVIPLTK